MAEDFKEFMTNILTQSNSTLVHGLPHVISSRLDQHTTPVFVMFASPLQVLYYISFTNFRYY